MDPWLEDEEVFPNLHERLTVFLQNALNAVLPAGYVATTRNRVWVDPELRREPDVSVFGRDRNGHPPSADASLAVAALSRTGFLTVSDVPVPEPREEPYLEIRSNKGKRLVTAVEVLSRSNKKPGDSGRTAYLQKQNEYLASSVNVVEIDLLRTGAHTTAFPADRLPGRGAYDYHVSILVPTAPQYHFFAPIRLPDRLPTIPTPLDWDVQPVAVDLQAVFDQSYDGGGYPELIDYRQPCDPPLTPDQQAWAEGVLKARGLLP
jgi:hypothetical protein